jgi:crossover junction endodeoxyribonuclease RusA
MKLTLPFPPSVNSLFGGGSAQKRFPSKKYKEWQKLCETIKTEPFKAERVSVCYTFYWPDNRARDLTNYVKAPEDFLVKRGIIADDSWTVVKHVELLSGGVSKEYPRVDIALTAF